ncbi:hypothetical protein PSCLAVI8L_220054 [Pseudoclavibacter sp. 8L]|nr:hypothetical protein PSCLAVI8L_220054 [Pseudoclavibacter sp. 8L]
MHLARHHRRHVLREVDAEARRRGDPDGSLSLLSRRRARHQRLLAPGPPFVPARKIFLSRFAKMGSRTSTELRSDHG